MMIIIEGMDHSGKTTLGKTLAAHFDWPLIHSPGFCLEMVDWAEESLLMGGPRICDRYPCISEFVYGTTLRDNNAFDSEKGKKVIGLFYDKKPLVIYCKPPDSVITKNLKGQMDGVEGNALTLIMNYNRLMAYLRLEGFLVIKYDFTEHSEIGWENLLAVISYKEEKRRYGCEHRRF